MSKKKRLFGILLALPPLLLGLLYGGGYIAQFMRNYHEWQAAGGTPGNGTSPAMPSYSMKKKQIHCPYCGAKASLRPASAVYGTATKVPDSYLYVCDRYPRCDSYVGAHKRTKEPMGTLANGDLRNKRIQAHKAFDWMWKSGLMTKWQAYKWMQGKLALTDEQAHIAKFSEYMCDRLIIECNRALENQRIAA